MQGRVAAAAILLAVVVGGCLAETVPEHEAEPPPHRIRTAEEKAAAEIFRAFAAALARNDAASACQHLKGRAYRAFRCLTSPRIPMAMRRRVRLGPLYAWHTDGWDADMHLYAPIRGPVGGNLTVFFHGGGDDWRINDALFGSYG